MPKWTPGTLSDSIASLDAGVSVNSEDRPHLAGEIGVLKTSALSGYEFHPDENKAVDRSEVKLVAEPVLSDSILISRMNTPELVGESCYVRMGSETLYLPDRIWQVKLKKPTIAKMRWLSYLLQSTQFRSYLLVQASGTSGSMKNLTKSDLLNFPVSYPSCSEQRGMAEVLATLDDVIENTRALVEKLERMKQGLLCDLLTRGVNSNGELRPPPSSEPDLYQTFMHRLIPKTWDVRDLAEVGEVVTGATPPSSDPKAWGNEIPFITPGDLSEKDRITKTARLVSRRGLRYIRILPPGTTVVVCIGSTIGKVGITSVPACTNQQINGVIPNSGVQPAFLFAAIRMYRRQMRALAGLQAVPIVNKTAFGTVKIPIPPEPEQIEISSQLDAIDTRIDSETLLQAKLKSLKLALMDDLLTGRVSMTSLSKK